MISVTVSPSTASRLLQLNSTPSINVASTIMFCTIQMKWPVKFILPLMATKNGCSVYAWSMCYAQLRLSHDSWESSCVDSLASLFGSLWCHEHVLCTCPFGLILFCLCVCWTPCVVPNPPFHNSKISSLKTGYMNIYAKASEFGNANLVVYTNLTKLPVPFNLSRFQFAQPESPSRI